MYRMKKLFGIFFILILFISGAYSPSFSYPSNAMVRVGIMDSAYKTVDRTEVDLYGTNDLIVIDSKTKEEVFRVPAGTFLNIKRENGEFSLSFKDSEADEIALYLSKNDFNIICHAGVIGIKDLIRGGKPALYRGEFRILGVQNSSDKFNIINCLDVEYYLKGVVPCEMPVHFGLEALKAQAVAARVYSLTPRTKLSRSYDVVDSVASQVYHGFNRESDIANKAIDETHGLVALYNDNMIVAVFCSTAGGYTESYAETFSETDSLQFPSKERPYLIAKPDLPEFKPLDNEEEAYKFYSTRPLSYDIHSPLYRWTRVWTKQELQNVLKNNLVVQSKTGFVEPKLHKADDFGELQEIRVTQRGESGKIVFMEIETDKKIYTVSKELIIRRLFTKDGKALPSANVVFKYEKDENGKWDKITAYGGGFGHGCGMSQFGAMYMAKDCKMSFETILKHYYNGICIGTKPFELKHNYVPQAFYAPKNKATLIIPDRKDMKVLQLKVNDTVVNLDLSKYPSRAEVDISKYINPKELNIVTFTPPIQNKLDKRRTEWIKPVKMYIKLL